MTRTRLSPTRFAALGALAIVTLSLSGCLYAAIPPTGTIIDYEPSPTASPETEGAAGTFSFADGQTMAPDTYIIWAETLTETDDWEYVESTSDGGWSYTSSDDTCTVSFWHGLLDERGRTGGDDFTATNTLLADVLDGDQAEVASGATDGTFTNQTASEPPIQTREATGTLDGGSFAAAARAFTVPNAGLTVYVECTVGEAGPVLDQITAENPVLLLVTD